MTTLAELAASKQHAGHSIFSPSSAHRWTRCLGSLVVNALADDRSSIYAAEGTVAHAMADEWLRTGVRPRTQVVMQEGYEITVDDDMLAYVEHYVNWVQEETGTPFFEQRVDFSAITPIPYQKGTADNFTCMFGKLKVKDLKYGKGIKVEILKTPTYEGPESINPQLGIYAFAVFDAWDWFYGFDTIEIGVCQPRLEWEPTLTITRAQLLEFAAWVKERATAAWAVDAPRTPGDHCWQCAAIRGCPTHLAWLNTRKEKDADDVFGVPALIAAADAADDMLADDLPIILPELSIEACCRVLPMRKAVESWFAAIETRVFAAALDGDAPGWKVVEGRANRAWIDEAAAKARMVEVGIPLEDTEIRKLVSPNQAEDTLHGLTKMGKKKARDLFDSLTERKDGVRTLTVSSDRREAVPSYGDVFDE